MLADIYREFYALLTDRTLDRYRRADGFDTMRRFGCQLGAVHAHLVIVCPGNKHSSVFLERVKVPLQMREECDKACGACQGSLQIDRRCLLDRKSKYGTLYRKFN